MSSGSMKMHNMSYSQHDFVSLKLIGATSKGQWVDAKVVRQEEDGQRYVIRVLNCPVAVKAGVNGKEFSSVPPYMIKLRHPQTPPPPAYAPTAPALPPPSAPTSAPPPRPPVPHPSQKSGGFFSVFLKKPSSSSAPKNAPPAPPQPLPRNQMRQFPKSRSMAGTSSNTNLPVFGSLDSNRLSADSMSSSMSDYKLLSTTNRFDNEDKPLTKEQLHKIQTKFHKWKRDRIARSKALVKLEKENKTLRVQVDSLTEAIKQCSKKISGLRDDCTKGDKLKVELETLRAELSFIIEHSSVKPGISIDAKKRWGQIVATRGNTSNKTAESSLVMYLEEKSVSSDKARISNVQQTRGRA
mmetsp:Transcript_22380/g.33340  ORF Transcript_22380/g.33340 Transcript_22380/m.33340 type:complete len:353 (+) Transcript_22380:124-1182(+)